MTNKKDESEQTTTSFFGKEIDPELQKKVDEYMDPGVAEVADAPEAPMKFDTSASENTASAPLLPTDKLPDLDKSAKKSKKKEAEVVVTQVIDHEQDESPQAEVVEEPDQQVSEIDHTEPEKSPSSEDESVTMSDELGLDDPQTAKAVDEIVAADADELMAVEDKRLASASEEKKRRGLGALVSGIFAGWWHHKAIRNSTFALLFLVVLGIAIVPTTRYATLNAVGVRSSASVVVLDDKTNLPLKNVELSLSGQVSKTDTEGKAKLDKIKLGEQNIIIKKPAFAEINQKVVIGWGSNPLGEMRLVPVGTQYTFKVTDYLSAKPIVKAEATSGESSALSNDSGEIVLTVPQNDKDNIEVIITANDYRKETIATANTDKEAIKVSMVPAKKHAFISKRTGTFDVYKIDVDGKNEERVLSGTGKERQDTMALVPHPKKNIVALVSARDNIKNQDGFNLSSLNIVNLDTNEVTKITDSERIQVVDWVGDRLVYVKITQGASEASTGRHKLMSYDIASENSKELASTNYFNDVLVARGAVYYTPAIYKVNGTVGLFKINPDGTNKKTLFDKEVWNLLRTEYDKVSASVGQDWYDLTLSTDGIVKATGAPSVLKSRVYTDGPSNQKSLWVDERDGKGVLVLYDTQAKQEKTIQSQGGLKNPVVWTDGTHVVYRIANGQETADYILSLDGGEPKKIKDVTNVAGVDRWYYY